MRLLAIDPSIKALGWAVFDDQGSLEDSGCYRPKLAGEWLERTSEVAHWVTELAHNVKPDRVVIEFPYLAPGDGKAGAAANAMSATKLFVLVGMLYHALPNRVYCQMVPIPVTKWKGQVKKHITMARVQRRYGWKGTDDNESDAIGIGDWYIRKSGDWS